MNLHSLKRKRVLGIENPNHYIIWAKIQREQGIDIESVIKLSNVELDYYDNCLSDVKESANRYFQEAVAELGLDYESPYYVDLTFNDTIQTVYYGAEKYEKFLYMIDIRPVSEFKVKSDIYKTLDKMSIDCGCKPIGQQWAEFKPELGKLTLRSLFQFDLTNKNFSYIEEPEAERLALEFIKPFDSSVRYFSNATEYPWATDQICSVNLQSFYHVDFGMILYDGTNIGMIVFAWDLY